MKKSSKVFCLLFAVLMLFTLSITAFAGNETNDGNIKIEVATDKAEYKATGVAEITATITNVSGEDIENVTAQAVFNDLAPAGKRSSETSKSVNVLKAGESFSFTYKATLNKSEHKLNIFEKIILFFIRFFNGGYTASNSSIDVVAENVTEIKFGKYSAENIVQVGYSENKENFDNVFLDLYSDSFDLEAGQTHDVVFYAEIDGMEVLQQTNVELYSESGFVGILYDNGEYPDIKQNDGIYSGKITLSSDNRKLVNYYAKLNNITSRKYCINFYSNITEAEEKQIELFKSDIELIKAKYSDESEYLNNVIQYLDKQNNLTYTITDFGIILVTFDFNYTIGVPISSINTQGTNNTISLYQNRSTMLKTTADSKLKIVTLQPSYNDLKTTVFDDGATAVSNSVYNYEFSKNLDNENVTIEELKKLSEYSIVIIDGHGGNLENFGYILQLSEKPTEEKNQKYENSNDLGSIIFDCGDCYIISESFFDKYYSIGDLTNMLFYIGTCRGGDTNVGIRDIIYSKSKNTASVLAFRNNVFSSYNRELFETIIEDLILGLTIEEAYIDARAEHGEVDPYNTDGNPAELILTGNKNWSFNYGYIIGLVKDKTTDERLSNITVTASNDNFTFSTKTEADGTFKLQLPVGNYTVSASYDGYISETKYTVTVEKDTAKTLPNPIYMVKTSTLTGTVTNSETGNPIQYVSVQVIDNESDSLTPVARATTNAKGEYQILNLPYGDYSISFTHDDYEYLGTTMSVSEESYTKNAVLTPAGERAKVTGTVTDSTTSEPIPYVTIQFINSENVPVWTDITDENGTFEAKLPYGTYTVTYTHSDYEPSQDTVVIDKEEVVINKVFGNRSVIDSGECGAEGDNVTWTLYDDGELVISGNGAMKDYEYKFYSSTAPWYSKNVTAVIIEEGITSIGNYSFYCNSYGYGLTNIVNISIPSTVKIIGVSAFHNSKLSQITISEGVATIGNNAFNNCDNITSIIIPDSITTIGDNAFADCDKLTTVTFGKNTSYIGDYAFWKCDLLEELKNTENISFLGTDPFYDTKWYKNQPLGIIYVGTVCYRNKWNSSYKTTEVVLKEGTTSIAERAFYQDYDIETIILNDGLKSIGDYAFSENDIVEIYIPSSVEHIGYCAFTGNPIKRILVDENNQYYSSDNVGALFDKCKTIILQYPNASENASYNVPSSVNRIEGYAFSYSFYLSEITMSDSISYIGYGAFENCSRLSDMILSNSVSHIDNYTFSHCSSLRQITLSKNIKKIDEYAFYDCASLTDVYYTGTQEEWKAISIDPDNTYLTNATIHYNS